MKTGVSYINLKIDRGKFRAHIKRICKGNIRNKCQICQEGNCPFLSYILDEIEAMGRESIK
jgi:hypothetical protein